MPSLRKKSCRNHCGFRQCWHRSRSHQQLLSIHRDYTISMNLCPELYTGDIVRPYAAGDTMEPRMNGTNDPRTAFANRFSGSRCSTSRSASVPPSSSRRLKKKKEKKLEKKNNENPTTIVRRRSQTRTKKPRTVVDVVRDIR